MLATGRSSQLESMVQHIALDDVNLVKTMQALKKEHDEWKKNFDEQSLSVAELVSTASEDSEIKPMIEHCQTLSYSDLVENSQRMQGFIDLAESELKKYTNLKRVADLFVERREPSAGLASTLMQILHTEQGRRLLGTPMTNFASLIGND